MHEDESEAGRIRDTTRWSRRWLAMKRNDDYGFIDALDVAGGGEILVRGNTVGSTNASMAREPLDGENLPVVARFDSVDALLDAGWRVD